MPSAIDPTKPAQGNALTADLRANLAACKAELEALMARADAIEQTLAAGSPPPNPLNINHQEPPATTDATMVASPQTARTDLYAEWQGQGYASTTSRAQCNTAEAQHSAEASQGDNYSFADVLVQPTAANITASTDGPDGTGLARLTTNTNLARLQLQTPAGTSYIHTRPDLPGKLHIQPAAGLSMPQGSGQPIGKDTLFGGSITIENTLITPNTLIIMAAQTNSPNAGALSVSARTPGANFTVQSDNVLDDRTIAYLLIEPV